MRWSNLNNLPKRPALPGFLLECNSPPPTVNSVWRGFILVHLNIHDSLHFCSKRHLFI
uniref:Uncharacterized protein n=1 Tax=Salvator merianae TaxID=96440 RepID=A0A8D0E6W9_SALMN